MAQTWKIKGQVYTLGQIQEMRKQGLNPHKDVIVMKFITNPQIKPSADLNDLTDGTTDEAKALHSHSEDSLPTETEEEEFKRLKTEKAWVNPAKKARYAELKAKLAA